MAATVDVFAYPDPLPSLYAVSQVQYDMAAETSYSRSSLCTPIQDEVVFPRAPSRCCNTPISPPPMEISRSNSVSGVGADAKAALLQQYFSSTGALARSILLEKASVEQEHSETWSVLSESRKDAIVDNHFVPLDVREQYEGAFVGARRLPRHSQRRLNATQVHPEGHEFERNQARNSSYKIRSLKQSRQRTESSLPDQTEGPNGSPFARNKLRSYSMRLKNGRNGRRRQLDSSGQENNDEIIPLFERDVNELDTGVDLPDDTLLTDHISSGSKDSEPFARMKPLRFSVGRKLRNKVDNLSSSSTPDSFVISNHSADLNYQQELGQQTVPATPIDPPVSTLTTPMPAYAPTSTFMHTPVSTLITSTPMPSPGLPLPGAVPDLTPAALQEIRALTASPISHDPTLTHSLSRASVSSPDSTMSGSVRGRGRTVDLTIKHPLGRSTRAGSTLPTGTSEFADRRQQFIRANTLRRRAGSVTPTTSPVPHASEEHLNVSSSTLPREEKKPSPLLQNIPIIRHEDTDTMPDISAEVQSPTTSSPPDSPADHTGVNRRESGYMSSTCDPDDIDASDEEKETLKPTPGGHRHRRRVHQNEIRAI